MSEMILVNAEGSCPLLPNSDIYFLIYYKIGGKPCLYFKKEPIISVASALSYKTHAQKVPILKTDEMKGFYLDKESMETKLSR